MTNIQTINIENINNRTIINMNYPYIKDNQLLKKINNSIYQDVITFKEIAEEEIKDLKGKKCLCYINTEYEVTKNRDDLISIYIEFSQLTGLYNINYINTYNYDINLGREITLDDIFTDKIYNKFINTYDNQSFYLEDDGVIICFSSYELGATREDISSYKIYFEDVKQHLSKYARERLYVC